MCIPSIRLTYPFCDASQEKQTTCSLIVRTMAISLGAISVLIGVLILCGIPVLSTLGTTGGSLFSGMGVLMLAGGAFLQSIKENRAAGIDNTFLKKPKLNTKHVGGDNSTNALNYSLDAVIERIREVKSKGMQTALFVGRTNDQVMPQEKGWAWFSLDIIMKPDSDCNSHLQINFNDMKVMKKIYSLFDQVIVDVSVIKFFSGSPWENLQPLLCKGKLSQLIVESDKGTYYIGDSLIINGSHGDMTMPFSCMEEDVHRPHLLDSIRNHLLTLFHSVELKKTAYPYRNEEDIVDYWIASNPK